VCRVSLLHIYMYIVSAWSNSISIVIIVAIVVHARSRYKLVYDDDIVHNTKVSTVLDHESYENFFSLILLGHQPKDLAE
jgi:hypothetical protein